MTKQRDSDSSDWVCEFVDKADPKTRRRCKPDTLCAHLEKKFDIPSMDDGDSPKFASEEQVAGLTMSVFDREFWRHDESRFIELMRNYGFTEEWDLDLLSAKYFRNLSVRDIEKEFHWTSKSAVSRKLRELRGLLKERGFEQERE